MEAKVFNRDKNASVNQQRLPMLDFFRIFICGMVFLFHAVIHNFWIVKNDTLLYSNLTTGALYMDAFFILSGFLLYYLYSTKVMDLSLDNLKNFYKKRFSRIYPQYIICTIAVILYSGKYILSAIPIEIFCLQGFFPMLFKEMGNGGLWFISCLMFCYLVFPLLSVFLEKFKKEILLAVILYIAIVYFNIVMVDLNFKWIALYIHPLYRTMEFLIGMVLGKLFLTKKPVSSLKGWLLSSGGFVLLFLLVPFLYKNNFINHVKFAKLYPAYSIISVPLFSIIIYSLACVKNKFFEKLSSMNLVKFFTAITFPFFIWGGMAQRITKNLSQHFAVDQFLVLFLVTFALAIISYLIIDKLFVYLLMNLKSALVGLKSSIDKRFGGGVSLIGWYIRLFELFKMERLCA